MLDIKRIREDFDGVKKAVESRGKGDFGIDKVREYDVERRKLLAEVEQMKNQQSTSSRQIPVLKKEGKDTTELMAEMKQLSEKIKVLDGQVSEVEAKLRDALLNIPNTPYEDVQEGADDSDNVELRKWGEPRTFDFDEKAEFFIRLAFQFASTLFDRSLNIIIRHTDGFRLFDRNTQCCVVFRISASFCCYDDLSAVFCKHCCTLGILRSLSTCYCTVSTHGDTS